MDYTVQARILEWVVFPFSRDLPNPGIKPRSPTFSSVQFSLSVVSESLGPHELQHARPPCPSQTPGVYPNPCPLSQWCHPTISSFVVPFSSHHQSFPAPASFQMSQLFPSGGQSIGASDSTSILPVNSQDWSPLGWTGWISLQSKGFSRVFSKTTVQKHQLFGTQLSSQNMIFIFLFWFTSCIIGSRFIHLIGTDSNLLLFMAE